MVFDESMPKEKRSELILSSSSIPFYFPAVKHEDQMLVDGGLFSDLNMDEAILRCREMGFNDSDIIVDVIFNFDGRVELKNFTHQEFKYQNAHDMFKRKEELHGFWRAYRDVIKQIPAYPEVTFRHMIDPLDDLDSDWKDDEAKM